MTVESLRLVGYWSGETSPGWPNVDSFIDTEWDESERHAVVQYLANGTLARTFMGKSSCRICGIENGYGEFSDGTYLWPTGLVHYVEAHAVRLPGEFVEHAMKRLSALEDASVEQGWWRDRTAP